MTHLASSPLAHMATYRRASLRQKASRARRDASDGPARTPQPPEIPPIQFQLFLSSGPPGLQPPDTIASRINQPALTASPQASLPSVPPW